MAENGRRNLYSSTLLCRICEEEDEELGVHSFLSDFGEQMPFKICNKSRLLTREIKLGEFGDS